MFAERDKHYPSTSGQTSLATAVTKFTKPVTKNYFGPSRCYRAKPLSVDWHWKRTFIQIWTHPSDDVTLGETIAAATNCTATSRQCKRVMTKEVECSTWYKRTVETGENSTLLQKSRLLGRWTKSHLQYALLKSCLENKALVSITLPLSQFSRWSINLGDFYVFR